MVFLLLLTIFEWNGAHFRMGFVLYLTGLEATTCKLKLVKKNMLAANLGSSFSCLYRVQHYTLISFKTMSISSKLSSIYYFCLCFSTSRNWTAWLCKRKLWRVNIRKNKLQRYLHLSNFLFTFDERWSFIERRWPYSKGRRIRLRKNLKFREAMWHMQRNM